MRTAVGTWAQPAMALGLLVVLAGCRSISTRLTLAPSQRIVKDQLVIACDFPLDPNEPLLEELAEQRDVVRGLLGVEIAQRPIYVFLFGDADAYRNFIEGRFPDFPARRAFFVETEGRLLVYAHWGRRVAEDLRHEVAHGYLHAALPNLPLWLDEGLAEYFEVPLPLRGRHEAHLVYLSDRMQAGNWRPNLARLEAIGSAADLSQGDYAEAWAWVHWLLESDPLRRRQLREYLNRLAAGASEGTFSAELGPAGLSARQLVQYVTQLAQPDAPNQVELAGPAGVGPARPP